MQLNAFGPLAVRCWLANPYGSMCSALDPEGGLPGERLLDVDFALDDQEPDWGCEWLAGGGVGAGYAWNARQPGAGVGPGRGGELDNACYDAVEPPPQVFPSMSCRHCTQQDK